MLLAFTQPSLILEIMIKYIQNRVEKVVKPLIYSTVCNSTDSLN